MVICGYCGHPGAHATIVKEVGGTKYCTGCSICQELLAQAAQQPPPPQSDDKA
jgi:Pyruvate/2-oxoacid:ferredoxin oxidoreductase delta subunit